MKSMSSRKFLFIFAVSLILVGSGCDSATTVSVYQPTPSIPSVAVPEVREAPSVPVIVSTVPTVAPSAPVNVPTKEIPVKVIAPAPEKVADPAPTKMENSCCKICSKGKACGDSCISRSYVCHKGPGCACDAE